jgi:hypothetical protein
MSARCVDCLNQAIERCEITGVPLCAEHLWYAEDGRRISERVARQIEATGTTIVAPQVYLSRLGSALALPQLPVAPPPSISLQRNGNDLLSVLSLISGVISLATCFGIGVSVCLPATPIVPFVLGVISLAGSKSATRPDQARIFSWVGIIAGGSFLLITVLLTAIALISGSNMLLPFLYQPSSP